MAAPFSPSPLVFVGKQILSNTATNPWDLMGFSSLWTDVLSKGVLVCLGSHRIVELLRLENASNINKSNCWPVPTMPLTHVPQCLVHSSLENLQGQWLHHFPGLAVVFCTQVLRYVLAPNVLIWHSLVSSFTQVLCWAVLPRLFWQLSWRCQASSLLWCVSASVSCWSFCFNVSE